ncbi:hypothetical protein R3P38DRAFT_2759365 [Favolaschia claudopus]|uniref:Uncharacterized protein n=1 Tax=Favolaschia claudopus TaxID=2862362 RepID=A0AAW0E8E1_9AGAR
MYVKTSSQTSRLIVILFSIPTFSLANLPQPPSFSPEPTSQAKSTGPAFKSREEYKYHTRINTLALTSIAGIGIEPINIPQSRYCKFHIYFFNNNFSDPHSNSYLIRSDRNKEVTVRFLMRILVYGDIPSLKLHRRRLNNTHRGSSILPTACTISQFSLLNQDNNPNAERSQLDTQTIDTGTRAQTLESELQTITEKDAEFEEQERDSEVRTPLTRGGVLPLRPVRRRWDADLEAELRGAREEISMLVARVNELEINCDSFARGSGATVWEEPLPEYARL